MDQDVRWKQRFDNFNRAMDLLQEVCTGDLAALSVLEQQGAVRRFTIAFQLGWKTLKDYLEDCGLKIDPVTPRSVFKEAFAARILDDGHTWIEVMLDRNRMNRSYDTESVGYTLRQIAAHHYPALESLRTSLAAKTVCE